MSTGTQWSHRPTQVNSPRTLEITEPFDAVTVRLVNGTVNVVVLDRKLDGDMYYRKILLRVADTGRCVQYGLVRFNFNYVTNGVRDEIIAYAGNDLLCYRAERPARLVQLQHERWDPLLTWVMERFGARLHTTNGVMPVRQAKLWQQHLSGVNCQELARNAPDHEKPLVLLKLSAVGSQLSAGKSVR